METMSDEESFVILGSSPMPSLETDGNDISKEATTSSLLSDTPGSRFSSLKNSQITALQNAQETSTQTEVSAQSEVSAHAGVSAQAEVSPQTLEQMACSKLWSKPQVQVEENMAPFSIIDCAVKPPFEDIAAKSSIEPSQKEGENVTQQTQNNASNPSSLEEHPTSSHKITPPVSANSSLASSFIMGEVGADVLKSSVYSQFPSISMEACAEDVVKLQTMVTEYLQLKTTLKKVNNSMKLFYNSSLQWKEKMSTMETQHKEQMHDCKKEIKVLRKQNEILQNSFKSQIEALEIARQKDREETIQEISEKNSLLQNMRAQIVRLEQQQLASFEFVAKKPSEKTTDNFDQLYVPRVEHELKIKELERKLSQILASNLDFKDLEQQYIDELNCLKVQLTAAEELINKNRADIAQLEQKIEQLEQSLNNLRVVNAEQNERILLLEHQNEVHRNDFEMEREGHHTVLGEKQQVLQDLRVLQKINQQLIEERQKLVDNYEKRLATSLASRGITDSIQSMAAASQMHYNNPQRPIRQLPSSSSTTHHQPVSTPISMNLCPICNKAFKSLTLLQSHVNDCIDGN